MAKVVVKSLTHSDGLRRVDIIKRDDGTFGFEEWRFSQHPDEQVWIPAYKQMETFVDSAETAEREARARVDWLINESPA